MIYIIGISIAFFLSLLLLSKKGKTHADNILVIWLLLIGVHLLLFYLNFSNVSYNYPFLLGLEIPLPLIHGPFLVLYTSSLTNQLNLKKKLLLLHFIPAITCYSYLISRFYFLPADQKIYVFKNEGIGFETFSLINLSAIVVSGISYVIWSIILLQRYRVSILSYFSHTEKINLRWLQYLIYGLSGVWILIFFGDEYIFAGVVIFVLFIGYFGINQVGIFTYNIHGQRPKRDLDEKKETVDLKVASIDNKADGQLFRGEASFLELNPFIREQAKPAVIEDNSLEKKKYLKSGLTQEMAESLHDKLTKLMYAEKVYTEGELFLPELAGRLDTLPNYLSQVINEKEGKNFYDYINSLRIEEFKRLVAIPANQKYTMLSLSYDCGFNSKSSFNKNFKKVTGQSPSEYLNSLTVETVQI